MQSVQKISGLEDGGGIVEQTIGAGTIAAARLTWVAQIWESRPVGPALRRNPSTNANGPGAQPFGARVVDGGEPSGSDH